MSLIAHSSKGSGREVAFLNGGLMTMASWNDLAGPLEKSYRVVRADFRGQMLSPSERIQSLEEHCNDYLAVLDALGIEKVDLVGASFGGFAGLWLAAHHPQRVRSLVAISTAEWIWPEAWAASRLLYDAAMAVVEGHGEKTKVFDLLIPATFHPDYLKAHKVKFMAQRAATLFAPASYFLGAAHIVAVLEHIDLRADLAKIACPTLIVVGEGDRIFPPEHSRALHEGIAGSRLEIVPGAEHGLVAEKTERVLELLTGFLAER